MGCVDVCIAWAMAQRTICLAIRAGHYVACIEDHTIVLSIYAISFYYSHNRRLGLQIDGECCILVVKLIIRFRSKTLVYGNLDDMVKQQSW